MNKHELTPFFKPKSIAVIGASNKKGSIGNSIIKNFSDTDFKGNVYAINPKYSEVEGFLSFKSLDEIPDTVDVVLIAVPANIVEKAVLESINNNVKYIVIFSSGFAELGEDGLERQNKILAQCKEKGIRVVGPNTMGTYDVKNQLLYSFMQHNQIPYLIGDTGIISQSGATGGTILAYVSDEDIGVTYMLTTGNQPDINTVDFLEYLVEDESTNQIAMYMEGTPDGSKFMKVAEKALQMHKPVVIMKGGRSKAGMKAAISHTASMAGSYEIFKTVAEQYGITIVEQMEEIVDVIKAFRSKKIPRGKNVAIVVTSGAAGIILADKISELGLTMADLTTETQNKLMEVVPDYCSLVNPVDIGATPTTIKGLYKHCMETLVKAKEVDILIVQMPIFDKVGLKMIQEIKEVNQQTDKPIIVCLSAAEKKSGDLRRSLNRVNVPAYSSFESAAVAVYQLVEYEDKFNENKKKSRDELSQFKVSKKVFENTEGSVVQEPDVKEILKKNGINIPRGAVAKERSQIQKVVEDLKYPLVAKVVSSDITHKSDVGGVIFPIGNAEELLESYDIIMDNISKNEPTAKIDGILIEELVDGPFLEVFVGVKNDPEFGPILLFGLGGIYVEVFKDLSQRVAPISKTEATKMIKELKSYPIFTGVRKGVSYDIESLADAISRISKLVGVFGDSWTELEINPLIVREENKGVMALDGLITLPNVPKIKSFK